MLYFDLYILMLHSVNYLHYYFNLIRFKFIFKFGSFLISDSVHLFSFLYDTIEELQETLYTLFLVGTPEH